MKSPRPKSRMACKQLTLRVTEVNALQRLRERIANDPAFSVYLKEACAQIAAPTKPIRFIPEPLPLSESQLVAFATYMNKHRSH